MTPMIFISLPAITICLAACALLGAKLNFSFIFDPSMSALCLDIYAAGRHVAKIRMFEAGEMIWRKTGSSDPKPLRAHRKHRTKDRAEKRAAVAAVRAFSLKADSLTIRLTLPFGDHPATEAKLLAANAALAFVTRFVIPSRHDCVMRTADVRSASLYGSVVVEASEAIECVMRCLSAAKTSAKK